MALRGLTLFSKFALIIALAKLFPPELVGVYGLFAATITYSIYLIGFDFYTYSTRHIIRAETAEWPVMIRDQFVFFVIVYGIVFPLLLFVFKLDLLGSGLMGWFYSLLIFEHLSQEANRLLIAMYRPIMASFVMFLRMGAWCYIVIPMMFIDSSYQTLTTVWCGWLIGSSSSVFLAAYAIKDLPWYKIKGVKVNWLWLRRGVRTAMVFFIGTLIVRALFTLDRYVLSYYYGQEQVGIYTLFISIANSMASFVDAGVIVFIYPKMVRAYRSNNISEFGNEIKKLTLGILSTLVIIFLGMKICISPLLEFLGRSEYSNNLTIFWFLMVAISFWCLGMIPHFVLYAKGKDKDILKATIFSFFIFAISIFLVVRLYSMEGLAVLLMSVFFIMACLKCYYAVKQDKLIQTQ